MILIWIALVVAIAIFISALCCEDAKHGHEGSLIVFIAVMIPGMIGFVISLIALLVSWWSTTAAMCIASVSITCSVIPPFQLYGIYRVVELFQWARCTMFHHEQPVSAGYGYGESEILKCKQCDREWTVPKAVNRS